MTHYVEYADPTAGTQLAICYVRIPSAAASPAPTCPWCRARLQERTS